MLELIIKKEKELEKIALIEDGKLVEYYEDDAEMERTEGNIYCGFVKDIIKGMQAAFIDIGNAKKGFIHLKEVLPKVDELKKDKTQANAQITDIIKPNQKLLVQVKKDSNERKGARVSTHISLPSKYIVLMPNTDIVTISQKVESKKEQERLIKLVKENLTKGNGAVIRTSAENKIEEIIEDIKKIEKKWNTITKEFNKVTDSKPRLILKAESIVDKMLIDLSDNKIEKITTNNGIVKKHLEAVIKENKELSNVKLEYETELDVFDTCDLEKQIAKMEKRKIWLNCGGFITIDATEALTAIDVNTGKYTGTKDLEETVVRVNEEASIEIVKQLRLRDIGGIIIIDYIDMKEKANKEKIQKILEDELKKDRSKTQVEGFTKLDLIEMTRKHICSHR